VTSLQRLIQLEDLTQHEIFNVKENYEKELINNYANSKDPKPFHNIITISKSGSLPVKDSVKAVSDEEKAQLFNEYFYSVFY